MLIYALYFCVIIFFIFDLFLGFKIIEYIYCSKIRKQPPMVSCVKQERKKIVKQILDCYPNAKNICDLGSGFGAQVRSLANNTNATVFGIENMLFSFLISRFLNIFSRKKSIIIWQDIFEYMDKTSIFFDVVIAYLDPKTTQKLKKYKNKIGVLITVDFEIEELPSTKIIDIGSGYTIYNNKTYPHRLFIYEFN